jgi:hypothetical protein
VVVEQLAQRLLGVGVLGQHTAAGDLGDVGRFEVDPLGKPVHQPGQLDLLVVEARDELAELLLRGDDDPVLAAALDAELLHDRLEVEHLLDVTSDELTDLVDDEQQALARLAALHQLGGAIGELAGRDVGLVLDRLHPRVGHRVRRGIERVHHPAGLGQREGDLDPSRPTSSLPPVISLVGGLEVGEPPLGLEGDLELGQVEVLGVAQALEEEPVHDLGQGLVAAADAAIGRDVEDDGVGRDLAGDDASSRTVSFLSPARAAKRCAAPMPTMGRLAMARPSSLAKLDLPEPKKPDTQTAMPSCGFCGVSR